VLREGFIADILLLDRARFRETAAFEAPVQYPEGIVQGFVAGKPAFTETGKLEAGKLEAGKFLGKYGKLLCVS
jgi:N-acyl-D-aspartate/D-glutamate deacylase